MSLARGLVRLARGLVLFALGFSPAARLGPGGSFEPQRLIHPRLVRFNFGVIAMWLLPSLYPQLTVLFFFLTYYPFAEPLIFLPNYSLLTSIG